MKSESIPSGRNVNLFLSRRVQLVAAVPSLLLWVLLSAMSLLWYGGVAFSAISGTLRTGDWRFPYLMILLPFVLVCAGGTARTLRRAYQGRSLLWWHGCSLGLGVVFLILIGIVGD